jgi:hypothetical protein
LADEFIQIVGRHFVLVAIRLLGKTIPTGSMCRDTGAAEITVVYR